MNKRYLNSILIVLLVIVWGGVIYKFFGNKKSTVEFPSSSFTSNQTINFALTKDTFQLELSNNDPFRISKRFTNPLPVKTTEVKPRPVTKPNPQKKITWPEITYHGFVKANGKDTRLIVLKINNKLYRTRENETLNNITLIKAFNDSLTVSFNKERKTIKRQ